MRRAATWGRQALGVLGRLLGRIRVRITRLRLAVLRGLPLGTAWILTILRRLVLASAWLTVLLGHYSGSFPLQ